MARLNRSTFGSAKRIHFLEVVRIDDWVDAGRDQRKLRRYVCSGNFMSGSRPENQPLSAGGGHAGTFS